MKLPSKTQALSPFVDLVITRLPLQFAKLKSGSEKLKFSAKTIVWFIVEKHGVLPLRISSAEDENYLPGEMFMLVCNKRRTVLEHPFSNGVIAWEVQL